MKTLTLLAALAAAAMLVVTPAFAQGTKAPCQPSASPGSTPRATKAPEKIEGEITKVDKKNGMLTVKRPDGDRKSTRLNSSHSQSSYAVFCLKKKNEARRATQTSVTE